MNIIIVLSFSSPLQVQRLSCSKTCGEQMPLVDFSWSPHLPTISYVLFTVLSAKDPSYKPLLSLGLLYLSENTCARLKLLRHFPNTSHYQKHVVLLDCISQSSIHSKEDVQSSIMKTTTTGSRIYISFFSTSFAQNTNFYLHPTHMTSRD